MAVVAKAVASDDPRDTHQMYVVVERDGCRILRVDSDTSGVIAFDRRVDPRVREAVHAVSQGEYRVE